MMWVSRGLLELCSILQVEAKTLAKIETALARNRMVRVCRKRAGEIRLTMGSCRLHFYACREIKVRSRTGKSEMQK
jgi:hypothetical protein